MKTRLIVPLGLLLACNSKDGNTPLTPEGVARSSAEGATVVVEGEVHAMTFDSVLSGSDFRALGDRFVLLRTVVPPGVSIRDQAHAAPEVAWGLGVRLPADKLATIPLPQIGDRVRVRGTFRRSPWNEVPMPMIEGATIDILSGAPSLAVGGQSCARDMDCHDRMICDRTAHACVVPEELTWGSDQRNVHGTCTEDDDCPLGQRCDKRYIVPATGPYSPPYHADRDAGKSLCVPEEDSNLETQCPRRARIADVVGGRFAPGKEVCIEADVWLPVAADDRDTHLQLTVHEPLPYPAAHVPYWVFGGTSENVPPYKDPSRPQGALVDPEKDEHVVVLGTVRWDDSHGWWEVHPLKAIYRLPARAVAGSYPTRPDTFDFEALEKE